MLKFRLSFAYDTYKERLYEAIVMQSYHRVLEILSIIQTIAPISYNEYGTFEVHKLYMESYVGRMAERSKALV